jgi:hypothetical protein
MNPQEGGEGDSTPPTTPATPVAPSTPLTPAPNGSLSSNPVGSPLALQSPLTQNAYLHSSKPHTKGVPLDSIVTADLESLLMKDNSQQVFMAAWHGQKVTKSITLIFPNME